MQWAGARPKLRAELSDDTIDLIYLGRGLHEELIAHVADQEGYYAEENVHVADPRRDFLGNGQRFPGWRVGCSAGPGCRHWTDGIGWKALSVNTDRPLVLVYGRRQREINGRSSGSPLAATPPALLPVVSRIVRAITGSTPIAI